MSQISQRFIHPDLDTKIRGLLFESITACTTPAISANFLEDILTPTEKIMIAKRIAIAYLLLKKFPYENIGATLKVSRGTIGTVSRILKEKGTGLRMITGIISRQIKYKQIFEDLVETALVIAGTGKGGNWVTTKAFQHHRKKNKSPF
jgi:uncharacterized protein YerC